MIKREQIPKEAIRDAWKVFSNHNADMADAIVAAINAWPKSEIVDRVTGYEDEESLGILLPLPLENNDE